MKLIFVLLVFAFLILFTIYFLPIIPQSRKLIHRPLPLPQLMPGISRFPLTYMQASEYKGPIVEGWPPERNRSQDLYIRPEEDTFPLKPTSKAVKNCKFLIMVHTIPDYFEARMGIRNSYGRYLSEKLAGNTALLFIIGNVKKSNNDNYEKTWNKLKKEQEVFGDILQVSTLMFLQ